MPAIANPRIASSDSNRPCEGSSKGTAVVVNRVLGSEIKIRGLGKCLARRFPVAGFVRISDRAQRASRECSEVHTYPAATVVRPLRPWCRDARPSPRVLPRRVCTCSLTSTKRQVVCARLRSRLLAIGDRTRAATKPAALCPRAHGHPPSHT
jgi:hypothetical protein